MTDCCVVHSAQPAFDGARELYSVAISHCTGCTSVYFLNAPSPTAALLNVQDRLRASFDHHITCPYLLKP